MQHDGTDNQSTAAGSTPKHWKMSNLVDILHSLTVTEGQFLARFPLQNAEAFRPHHQIRVYGTVCRTVDQARI